MRAPLKHVDSQKEQDRHLLEEQDRHLLYLADYLELINWTGQAVRDDKRGAIAEDLPPILERIGITGQARLQLAKDFETHFSHWIGEAEHVEQACQRGGYRWAHGIRACRRLFPS